MDEEGAGEGGSGVWLAGLGLRREDVGGRGLLVYSDVDKVFVVGCAGGGVG